MMSAQNAHGSRRRSRVTGYLHPTLATALAPIVALLAPLLRAELARAPAGEQGGETSEAGAWVDQKTSPLGRRAHCRACRTGAVNGARLVGRRWLARRADVDAYIEAHGGAPSGPNDGPAIDDAGEVTEAEIAEELASVGHTLAPKRARKVGGVS
jgi:hypothetical protein